MPERQLKLSQENIPQEQILQEQALLHERAQRLAMPISTAEQGSVVEVVSFSIGSEKFLMDTQFVLEIAKLKEYTPVPGTPDFIVGVTNLRGTILALVELRKFFTLPSRGLTDLTRIIVVGRDKFEFGILAEKAEQTQSLRQALVLDVPDNISSGTAKYLKGVTSDALLYLDAAAIIDDERLYIG